jgi:TonB family protein
VIKTLVLLIVYLASGCLSASGQDRPLPTTPGDQVRLGNEYLALQDYDQAIKWFSKAAQQGDPAGQNNLGWLYEKGFGISQDYSEAASWFLKSANQRNADAQNNLGWLYQNGWGVKQDFAEAMAWYRKAAAQENTRAQENIGDLYEKGLGVNQDYGQAMVWYRKAADHGNADARVAIGWLYEHGWGVKEDYAEAATWYLEAADKGNAYAQNNLGVLYERGLGVERDYTLAMAWYYRAANQGHAQAQNNLGLLYRNGLGDKRDYVQAMKWFRKAADQGNEKAEVNIGSLFEEGLGVQQDCAEAATWYRKAADQGSAPGQTSLGSLYQNGCGVKQDYAEAIRWYRKAAEQNDAGAENNLGWLYQTGLGVKQDYAEAMTWYGKAADQGNARAKTGLDWLSSHGAENKRVPVTESTTTANPTSEKVEPPKIILAGGIVAPRATYTPDPEYSEPARRAKEQGEVLVWLVVDPNGKPRDVKVLAPLGDGLDEKATEAIKTWKFEPATKDGKPVAVQIMVEVSFRLYGTAGMGKVDVVGDPEGTDTDDYLAPIVSEAEKCWSRAAEDKTHPPSIKQGQLTIQFAIQPDGAVGGAEIALSSGDEVLDRDARQCVAPLKIDRALPADVKGKNVVVRMQLLYNVDGMSINPLRSQVGVGSREQFYIGLAGNMSKDAGWSLAGAGCNGDACGTISSDGLYIAPEVLPQPPFVRVKARLSGANPLVASAVVTLVEKRTAVSGKVH